jgi:quinol monooxygenase YgiN
MIHKLVTYEVRKESVPQALELVRAFVDEVGRKEGGIAKYQVWQDAAQPTRFTHHVVFRVPSAEDYHKKTAWNKRFTEALAPLCAAPPVAAVVNPVAGG